MKSKTRALSHACILLLLAGFSVAASAQSLPKPAEFYFDEDPGVTRAIVAVPGSDDATVEQLVRLMKRGGRNADEVVAQLAHLSMVSGRIDNGKALYARAVEMTTSGSTLRRAVHWNQAWDLYRAGDVEGALAQWPLAFTNRIVHPAWVPPTLALALWKLDRREEAVAWYAAAVRTYPDRWSNQAALPGLLPDWSEADRAVLAEVLAAWRENPPAWP